MKKPTHERGFLVSCLLAQSVWLAVSVVLLLLFCAISVSAEDPARLITPLSLCALYLGSASAGIAAVKLSGDGILSGLVSGVISAILTLSLLVYSLPRVVRRAAYESCFHAAHPSGRCDRLAHRQKAKQRRKKP